LFYLKPWNIPTSNLLSILAGTLSLLVGISVLIGWYTHNEVLIQVSSILVPMQFNTALCFVMSGLGILVISSGRRYCGIGCGSIVALIGVMTLAEYILAMDFGIDQFLMQHYITVQTTNPGRMAPSTALCFTLTGCALVLINNSLKNWKFTMTVGILGSIIIGFSIVALASYRLSFEAAYGWGGYTRMAVHTATSFVFIGIALASLAWQRSSSHSTLFPFWFPISLGVGVGTLMLSLWLAFDAHEEKLLLMYGVSGDIHLLNNILLVIGSVLAAAISLSAYLVQCSRNREREIQLVNENLTIQITDRQLAEASLRESEERWQFALEGNRDGVWDWNLVTNEVFFSNRWKEMFGYDENDVINNLEEWEKRVHPEDKAPFYDGVYRHFDPEISPFYENQYRVLCKDNSYKWILDRGKVVLWADDHRPLRMIGTYMDITHRKLAEEQLQLSSRVFSETTEGIMITNAKGIITDVNPAFCEITGYSSQYVVGQKANILNSGKHPPGFYAEMWKALNEQGHWKGEIWNRKKNGEVFAELLSISSILDDDNKVLHYVGIFSDITRSKEQQEALVLMAHYDVLTQLPNRVLLADRFSRAVAHSKRNKSLIAVCFIDLDNFKPVNDNFGHDIGDQLLIEVSGRIKENVRDEDTASRQGGDEFVLLLGDIDNFSECEKMLKRINQSLAEPFHIDDKLINISASIGVSLYPMDGDDLDPLMRHADQAMYQAKLAGRNGFHLFNVDQDEQEIKKHILLKEIQLALSNNEFCLYFQPKVNMATGEVFGAEALIRWLHPEKGLILPNDFLPIVERTELEVILGKWVINEALKQLDKWNQQGLELEVSINISSFHLQSSLFVDELDDALARYKNVDSKCFQLEILESSALADLDTISSIIKSCRHTLGVNIALDDFGTGYSSLTHLKNLSANTIKIDQTFVRDVLDDPNDYAIIDGVIGLANSFNREVIAEGVESSEHGLMLLLMGCKQAQGFGIAHPMPADDVSCWLKGYVPNQEWISYGNQICNAKEDKVNLFRLALKHWLINFENNITSVPDEINDWPIMTKRKSFCGHWIRQARHKQLFDENWLKRLDAAHEAIHYTAVDTMNKQLNGELEVAKDGLKQIHTNVEEINGVLAECA